MCPIILLYTIKCFSTTIYHTVTCVVSVKIFVLCDSSALVQQEQQWCLSYIRSVVYLSQSNGLNGELWFKHDWLVVQIEVESIKILDATIFHRNILHSNFSFKHLDEEMNGNSQCWYLYRDVTLHTSPLPSLWSHDLKGEGVSHGTLAEYRTFAAKLRVDRFERD